MIRFPVIQRVKISGYELFPRNDGSELERVLPRGVTLIVGVNGLGKTTLLNALFRVLSGPADWSQRKADAPAGSSPTTLGDWKNSRFFRRRVRDDAKSATIEATVGFGDETLTVRRSLRDLSILNLSARDQHLPATEEAYREAVQEISGVQSFEDFFVVLRYLTFFLEDRQPIVWDASAQSDILRILFFDPADVTRARQLFDKIQSADSQRRNTRVIYNRLTQELEERRAAAAAHPDLEIRLRALQTRADALEQRRAELMGALEEADGARREARQRVELMKLEIQSLRSEYADYERAHLSHLFPDAPAIAQFVFLRRESGCLVCGNREPDAGTHIDQCAADHVCPVCLSPRAGNPDIVGSGELNEARMRDLMARIDTSAAALAAREEALQDSRDAHARMVDELTRITAETEEVNTTFQGLNAQMPPSSNQILQMAQEAKALRQDMEKWATKQLIYEREFQENLSRGEAIIRKASGEIAARFSVIAGEFLSETCDIRYEAEMRRIGTEGVKFPFPRFTVRMTSATMPNEVTARPRDTDVSESQKEFIDLAFRMALMDVAAAGEPTMLVIETPEASLDVYFVERAGRLLGEFGNSGHGTGNRLIASSNLTRGDMISALLGAIPDADGAHPPHHIPPNERDQHVLNLLELAAPNEAMRQRGEKYWQTYMRAVLPEQA